MRLWAEGLGGLHPAAGSGSGSTESSCHCPPRCTATCKWMHTHVQRDAHTHTPTCMHIAPLLTPALPPCPQSKGAFVPHCPLPAPPGHPHAHNPRLLLPFCPRSPPAHPHLHPAPPGPLLAPRSRHSRCSGDPAPSPGLHVQPAALTRHPAPQQDGLLQPAVGGPGGRCGLPRGSSRAISPSGHSGGVTPRQGLIAPRPPCRVSEGAVPGHRHPGETGRGHPAAGHNHQGRSRASRQPAQPGWSWGGRGGSPAWAPSWSDVPQNVGTSPNRLRPGSARVPEWRGGDPQEQVLSPGEGQGCSVGTCLLLLPSPV